MTSTAATLRSQRGAFAPLWLGAIFAGWLGSLWWPAGQAGDDLLCAASVLAWVVCLSLASRGWRAYDTATAYRAVRTEATKQQHEHGNASWASWKDCKKAGMTKLRGLFLGTLGGRDVTYNGEGSMVVFGGPGQQKTTASVMQQLARLDRDSSAVVLDLKLENYLVWEKDLRRRGFDVKCVNPWSATFNRDFGGSVKTHDDGFDPCLLLRDSESIIDDARLVASLLSGTSTTGLSGTEAFFKSFEEDILVAHILLLISRQGSVTLPELRRAVMAPQEHLEAGIEEMERSDAFSGVLAEYGARLAGPYIRAPKEFSGGLSGAQRCLNWLDAHSPLSMSMSREATTDPRTMKERPTVIFFGIPAEKVITHERWLGLVLTSTLEMIARDRRKRRVVALIDEAQQCPPSVGQILLKSISLYRSVGLQTVLYYQFGPAAARQLGNSWRELLGVDCLALFGHTNDTEMLRLFSELMGERTVRSLGVSGQPDSVAQGDLGVSLNWNSLAQPLMRSPEIRQLEDGKALYFVKNRKPLLLDKQSYLDNPKLRRRAAKNPYYRK